LPGRLPRTARKKRVKAVHVEAVLTLQEALDDVVDVDLALRHDAEGGEGFSRPATTTRRPANCRRRNPLQRLASLDFPTKDP